MDQQLVKTVKDYIMPFVLHEINAVKIPRIDYNGGYVENVGFNFGILNNNSITFSFDPTQNAVVLTCVNIHGEINGRFNHRLLILYARGWFKASFQDGGVSLRIVFPVHNQLVNGRLLPKIDVSNFNIDFNTSKVKIVLGGGFFADIADIFIWLFKSSIINSIKNNINQNVPGALRNII